MYVFLVSWGVCQFSIPWTFHIASSGRSTRTSSLWYWLFHFSRRQYCYWFNRKSLVDLVSTNSSTLPTLINIFFTIFAEVVITLNLYRKDSYLILSEYLLYFMLYWYFTLSMIMISNVLNLLMMKFGLPVHNKLFQCAH